MSSRHLAVTRALAVVLLVPALAQGLASCSRDDSTAQPSPLAPAPTRAVEQTTASGLRLALPTGWTREEPTTGGTWALVAGAPDSAQLLVSAPLAAGSGEQARMLATALLGAALPGYTETGSYTSGTAGAAVASPRTGEGVIHLAFVSTDYDGVGRAWVLATADGWVVVALAGADDDLALEYEHALVTADDEEDGS